MNHPGEALAFLSACAFALSNVFISRTRGARGDNGVLFSVLMTMAMSLALYLVLEAGRASPLGPGAMAGLGWFAVAGVMAMVLGRSFVFTSIRGLGVARSSAVKRLTPFFSVLFAASILHEPVTMADLGGMAAIALALAILVGASLRREAAAPGRAAPPGRAYLPGLVAAVAYALAYVARKLGLVALDAPALGTFVSAATGFAVFAGLAVLLPAYRAMFRGLFRDLTPGIVIAAVLISSGQILMFAALAFAPVTNVVMIASLEVFLSIFLVSVVFRDEPFPDRPTLLAAALATAGALSLAAG